MKIINTILLFIACLSINAQLSGGSFSVLSSSGGTAESGCENIAFLDGQTIKLNPSDTKDITLVGGYFDASSTVSSTGFTVNSISFISHDTLVANVTSGATEALYPITISNECGDQEFLDLFEIKISTWIDLRSGSGDNPTITARAGLTPVRDAQGLYLMGNPNNWGNWVQFPDQTVTRGGQTKWGFVFTKTAASNFMVGIGNTAFNPTSTTQWNQQEWMLYTYSANIWGYYGNNGTIGSVQNQAANSAMTYGQTYKVIFSGDGEAGQQIQVFEETDGDFDTNETLLTTSSVTSTNTADETALLPVIVPYTTGNGFYRIVAYIVE